MDKENKNKEVEYIRSQRKKGISDESIKKTLLKAGWSEEDVTIGFSEVDKESVPVETPQKSEDKTDLSEKKPGETAFSQETAGSDSEDLQEKETVSSPLTNATEEKNDSVMNSSGSLGEPVGQNKNNLTSFILIGIVIFLVLVGASVAAFYIMKGTGEEKTKEEVMVESLVSYLEADSFSSTVDIDIKTGEDFNFFAKVDGYFKQSESLLDSAMNVVFKGGVKLKNQGLTVEMGAEGETRLVDGVYYINLSKAPEVPFFPDLSVLENKWLHVDLEKDLSLPEKEDLDELSEYSKDIIKFINNHGVQILEIAQNKDFLKIESLNDKDLYKYLILIDFEKTGDFLNGLAEELPLKEIANDFPVEEKEISDLLKAMASEFEGEWEFVKEELPIDDFTLPFEFHVEKKSGNIKMVLIDHSYNIKTTQELSQFFGGKESIKLEIFVKSIFKDFDKEFKVDKPNDSKAFEEVMEEMMMEMMMGMSTSQDALLENTEDESYLIEFETEAEQDFNFNDFLQAGAGWFKGLR